MLASVRLSHRSVWLEASEGGGAGTGNDSGLLTFVRAEPTRPPQAKSAVDAGLDLEQAAHGDRRNLSHSAFQPRSGRSTPVDEFVARLNIQNYRQLLAAAVDEDQKALLLRLLTQEEETLAALEKARREKR
jgi:hypothetical protein